MLFYVKPKDSEAPVTAKANMEPKTIKCAALTHYHIAHSNKVKIAAL